LNCAIHIVPPSVVDAFYRKRSPKTIHLQFIIEE
jgi:hypothetical protein